MRLTLPLIVLSSQLLSYELSPSSNQGLRTFRRLFSYLFIYGTLFVPPTFPGVLFPQKLYRSFLISFVFPFMKVGLPRF